MEGRNGVQGEAGFHHGRRQVKLAIALLFAVILSGAKDLLLNTSRSFASLRMTATPLRMTSAALRMTTAAPLVVKILDVGQGDAILIENGGSRVLIDGGTTNPLPYDILFGHADVVLAVDVFGIPAVERADMPGTWEAVYTTILVMGGAILAAKLKHAAPDLLIRPNVTLFRTLDFYQATSIMRTAEAVKKEVKEKLGMLLQ